MLADRPRHNLTFDGRQTEEASQVNTVLAPRIVVALALSGCGVPSGGSQPPSPQLPDRGAVEIGGAIVRVPAGSEVDPRRVWGEPGVTPPCPPPPVDTTYWNRVVAVGAVSILVPPGWSITACGPVQDPGRLCSPDGVSDLYFLRTVERPGRPAPIDRSSEHRTYDFTACEESIAGQQVYLAVGTWTGYDSRARAIGTWELRDGTYVTVTSHSARREVHDQMLTVLRTVMVVP